MASNTGDEPPLSIRPVFQGLGSRLRRAFSGEPGNIGPPTPTIQAVAASEATLSNTIFIAAGAESRASAATDYRTSSEQVRNDLVSAKRELELALEPFDHGFSTSQSARREKMNARFMLARIHTLLGDYVEAEGVLKRLTIFLRLDGEQLVPHDLEEYEVEFAIGYLKFLATSMRNLDYGRRLGEQLLERSEDRGWPANAQCGLLLWLIRIQCLQKDFGAAELNLMKAVSLNSAVLMSTHNTIRITLARAMIYNGSGELAAAQMEFNGAMVQSATLLGLWHPVTCEVFEHYGIALKSWSAFERASSLLSECCLARYHQLGPSHPSSKRVFTELEVCKGSRRHLDTISRLHKSVFGMGSKRSVAFEHIYLNSVIDFIRPLETGTLQHVERILQGLVDEVTSIKLETAEHRASFVLRMHRALAICQFEQGKVQVATASMEGLASTVKRSVEGNFQTSLDLATFYRDDENNKSKAMELSRAIFFDTEDDLDHDQARAFQRRLARFNLTHFNHESIVKNPLPIKVLENVGTGAYAVVESVQLGSRLYARKSIALPRYNQNRVRQTIQNEISVIRALEHPHIVQIHCTYEEKSRFAIILQPLASCDLEAYLEQHEQSADADLGHHKLMWKWFGCLSNTLAFIHSQGVKHRDIKTRNILIKDFEVLFADFGSSHAFLDEGTSVTDGPSFGHTRMYSAPEVISSERRGRSADIFSLGCVFSEMATVLDGRSVSDYYDFRAHTVDNRAAETHAYHATLGLVDSWFKEAQPDVEYLYQEVILPMLNENPKDRPTASTMSEVFTNSVATGDGFFNHRFYMSF